MKNRVLIISNDPNLCVEIQNALCKVSMIVDAAFSPFEAIDLFLRYDYSLMFRVYAVLDIVLYLCALSCP